jgi:hypothetical protein
MVVLIEDCMKMNNVIGFPISCKGFSALKRLNRLMRDQQRRVFSVARLTSIVQTVILKDRVSVRPPSAGE